MSKLSNEQSRNIILLLFSQPLKDLYLIFEVGEILDIINTNILIHSFFENSQSKSESKLIEHIKNFIPNKYNKK